VSQFAQVPECDLSCSEPLGENRPRSTLRSHRLVHCQPCRYQRRQHRALISIRGRNRTRDRTPDLNVSLKRSDQAVQGRRVRFRLGWSVEPIVWNGIDMVNPLSEPAVNNNCIDANPGWCCDPKMTDLLWRYSGAADEDQRGQLAGEFRVAFHANVDFVLGCQFSAPVAYRSNLHDVIPFAFSVFSIIAGNSPGQPLLSPGRTAGAGSQHDVGADAANFAEIGQQRSSDHRHPMKVFIVLQFIRLQLGQYRRCHRRVTEFAILNSRSQCD